MVPTAEEREFWTSHDSTDHVDWSRAEPTIFPRLKPSTVTISLRLPESVVDNLKALANKRDVPYQSLLKVFLAERIDEELRINWGPGYRVYFTARGEALVILLAGGDKRTQARDIRAAIELARTV